MPQTRYIKVFQNGVVVGQDPVEISDEQLADEVEQADITAAINLIDGIDSLAKARTFLKKLAVRLVKKGILP